MQAAFSVLRNSLAFYFIHGFAVLGLTLFAALGRAIQLGWPERIPPILNGALEIMVEAARLLIVVYVIWQSFSVMNDEQGQLFAFLWQNLASRWMLLLWSILVFAVFALLVNGGIRWIAQYGSNQNVLQGLPLLSSLDKDRLSLVIVFFLKNLTIIPFTLVWLCYGLVRLLR
ncbi:MAG: hypothetical protein U0175_11180 [Caldilineaceae bacterium]